MFSDGPVSGLEAWWRFDFDIDWLQFADSLRDMAEWSEELVDVLPSLTYMRGGRVATDHESISITEYLATFPEAVRPQAAKSAASIAAASGATRLVAENPWMLHHLDQGKPMIKRKLWCDDTDAGDEQDNDEQDDEEILELSGKIFADLADVRMSVREAVIVEHFRIGPLGGNWTMRRHGVLFDAYKGWAHGQSVSDWCDAYNLPKSARFNVALYGNEGSIAMATSWMHRMNWLFEAWLDAGSPNAFRYEDGLIAQYREPLDFTALANGFTAVLALRRVQQLRSLRPHGCGK
jgi:hypothetical protein